MIEDDDTEDPRVLVATISIYDAPPGHPYLSVMWHKEPDKALQAAIRLLAQTWNAHRKEAS